MNAENSNLELPDVVNPAPSAQAAAGPADEEQRSRRRRRAETLIYVCWGLIVIKSFAVVWAVGHYSMPFNPMWVVVPTVTFAMIATAAYYWLRD